MTDNFTNQLLNNRYQIIKPLGRGGIGFTYIAEDIKNQENVAIKFLSLKRAADWKKLELFEREAKVLSQLNHSAIPHYIDYFQIDTERDINFCITQKLAPGKSLDQWIESGWFPTPEEIEKIAIEVLKILIYLQSLLPPIIHRDIKPQNIIRDENGDIFLVDFGSVQDTYRQNVTQGSTVVGTFGYMSPEQFRGQAVLSTDLYGLGATLLYLITGQSPAEFPQRQFKIEFRQFLHDSYLNSFLIDWLEKLLEPNPKYRFPTAQVALDVLQGKQPLPALEIIQKPLGTPIKIDKNKNQIRIEIPPLGFRTPQIQRFAISNLICNGFLGFVVTMIVSLQLFLAPTKLISFWLLVAIGLFWLVKYIYAACGVTQITIDKEKNILRVEKFLLGTIYQNLKLSIGKKQKKKRRKATTHPIEVKVTSFPLWPWRKIPLTYCTVKVKRSSCSFGGFLTREETEWLRQEITSFLQT